MPVRKSTEAVEQTLSQSPIHKDWVDRYRTSDNVKFFWMALTEILRHLKLDTDAKILEVGCGTCTKSIIMASCGHRMTAIDLSEDVLEKAKANIVENNLQDRISVKQGNVLDLQYENQSFDCVLVWGVLMHVPELEAAMKELSRVIKKNGVIIIAENNMNSVQSLAFRLYRFLFRKDNSNINITQSSKESWSVSDRGSLLVREMNMQWFKNEMVGLGFTVEKHIPGQFSDMYAPFSSTIIKKSIHLFNYFWFRYIKIPQFAFGHIIIFKKKQ
ncbi:class I SAM-dependent methyltransferase [Alphaproteobacteria bacterium]|nr:class I SAM-dependent methyltransferase [Alphaproteobacteria bacterium]